MRATLAKWVSDADALHHVQRFGFSQLPLQLSYLRSRDGNYHYCMALGCLIERRP